MRQKVLILVIITAMISSSIVAIADNGRGPRGGRPGRIPRPTAPLPDNTIIDIDHQENPSARPRGPRTPSNLRRIPECGIESYFSSKRPECGVDLYLSATSEYCGVNLYKTGRSKSCPGYLPQIIKNENHRGRGARCRTGRTIRCIETSDGGDFTGPMGHIRHMEPSFECSCSTREEHIASCRMPQFGIESYKTCRAPQHGIESYKFCEDESKPIYKACDAKTRVEIEAFIETVDANLDFSGSLLLTQKSNILFISQSTDVLACFINDWENKTLDFAMIEDFKQKFLMLTGEEYSPELAINCDEQNLSLDSIDCSENDKCLKAKRAYNANMKWLLDNEDKTRKYLDEPAVLADQLLKDNLLDLNERINEYLE